MLSLRGYQNPVDIYPASVIPIVEIDGVLFAIHDTRDGEADPVTLQADETYVPMPDGGDTARGFNFVQDRLFAFEQERIVSYSRAAEPEFFCHLLANSHVALDRPFVRYSLAILTRDAGVVGKELAGCLAWLLSKDRRDGVVGDPTFIERWYEQQAAELNRLTATDSPWLSDLALPPSWREVDQMDWYVTQFAARPQRGIRGPDSGGLRATAKLAGNAEPPVFSRERLQRTFQPITVEPHVPRSCSTIEAHSRQP